MARAFGTIGGGQSTRAQMQRPFQGVVDRFLQRRAIARWRKAEEAVATTDLTTLDRTNERARKLQRAISRFQRAASNRLARPRIGSATFPQPPGTDWAWRPAPWRIPVASGGLAPVLSKMGLGSDLVVFHDCKCAEISLRQTRNSRAIDLAPFGIDVEVFHFTGSYLSLVIEIPEDSCKDLRKRHLIRLTAMIDCERPTAVHARLNVKNGPNTEQILLTLPEAAPETMAEFDLAYSGLNERRAERMWIDLMIEDPTMNRISIRDLTLCRYPRAEI